MGEDEDREAWVARQVEGLPPLSEWQVERVRRLLAPADMQRVDDEVERVHAGYRVRLRALAAECRAVAPSVEEGLALSLEWCAGWLELVADRDEDEG